MYQGRKVRLRAYSQLDLDDVLRQVNDYDSVRMSASGIILPATRDDESRWISQQTSMGHGEYQFAIETLDGRYVGGCGFHKIDWKNRVGLIGILIGDAGMRGHGYGSDAVRVLCRVGYNEMNLNKLSLTVMADNTAAIRCYSACGFKAEGNLRGEVWREGSYHDLVAMGLLRGEWNDDRAR
ncbi:MAG: GNAT family N-acetyltransferase [Oscillospiraceae bacterium]|jgi:RimJ/RimL family protein N-acetyltransferase|nr:GNAT family N-acetyltransferase [Oscillospiraceae bacterium]